MATPTNSTTFSGNVWAELRLADARGVPHIHSLIHRMAEFELLTDLFAATHDLLTSTFFPTPHPPPFTSFIALILDLSPSPIPASSAATIVTRRLDLSASPLADPEAAAFASPGGGGRVTAGFVICFPNYSTFLAKPGLYVEDVFVRPPWRRRGLGRMMLSAVAGRAAEIGMGRVELCVLDWNKNAIDFYEGMGAEVFQQWRICRLTGAAQVAGFSSTVCAETCSSVSVPATVASSAPSVSATSPSEASGARPAANKSSGSGTGSSARSIPELYEERGAHSLRELGLQELRGATGDFSPLLMVGEGGFGCVYRGVLRLPGGDPHGTAVAVKRLNPNGGQVPAIASLKIHQSPAICQGHKEWLAEIHFLGVLEHPNLLKLVGYCAVKTDRGLQGLLVYEFMPNKTLDDHLFNRAYHVLPWVLLRGCSISMRA